MENYEQILYEVTRQLEKDKQAEFPPFIIGLLLGAFAVLFIGAIVLQYSGCYLSK